MAEVVAEIVQSLTGVTLERAEEAFANSLKRLGDSGPEFSDTIPPFFPSAELIPPIENTLDGVKEVIDAIVNDIGYSGPHRASTLEVTKDGPENRGPSGAECFRCGVDQLRESLNLRRGVVRGVCKTHDFVSLLFGVTRVQQLLTRQITRVLGERLDHDLGGKPSARKRVSERTGLIDHLVDFNTVGSRCSLQGFLELLAAHTGVHDRVPVL